MERCCCLLAVFLLTIFTTVLGEDANGKETDEDSRITYEIGVLALNNKYLLCGGDTVVVRANSMMRRDWNRMSRMPNEIDDMTLAIESDTGRKSYLNSSMNSTVFNRDDWSFTINSDPGMNGHTYYYTVVYGVVPVVDDQVQLKACAILARPFRKNKQCFIRYNAQIIVKYQHCPSGESERHSVRENDDLRLRCNQIVDGANVYWYFEGKYTDRYPGKETHLNSVQKSESGVYTCFSSDFNTDSIRKYRFDVDVLPTLTAPRTVSVLQTDRNGFTVSWPEANNVYYKDNVGRRRPNSVQLSHNVFYAPILRNDSRAGGQQKQHQQQQQWPWTVVNSGVGNSVAIKHANESDLYVVMVEPIYDIGNWTEAPSAQMLVSLNGGGNTVKLQAKIGDKFSFFCGADLYRFYFVDNFLAYRVCTDADGVPVRDRLQSEFLTVIAQPGVDCVYECEADISLTPITEDRPRPERAIKWSFTANVTLMAPNSNVQL